MNKNFVKKYLVIVLGIAVGAASNILFVHAGTNTSFDPAASNIESESCGTDDGSCSQTIACTEEITYAKHKHIFINESGSSSDSYNYFTYLDTFIMTVGTDFYDNADLEDVYVTTYGTEVERIPLENAAALDHSAPLIEYTDSDDEHRGGLRIWAQLKPNNSGKYFNHNGEEVGTPFIEWEYGTQDINNTPVTNGYNAVSIDSICDLNDDQISDEECRSWYENIYFRPDSEYKTDDTAFVTSMNTEIYTKAFNKKTGKAYSGNPVDDGWIYDFFTGDTRDAIIDYEDADQVMSFQTVTSTFQPCYCENFSQSIDPTSLDSSSTKIDIKTQFDAGPTWAGTLNVAACKLYKSDGITKYSKNECISNTSGSLYTTSNIKWTFSDNGATTGTKKSTTSNPATFSFEGLGQPHKMETLTLAAKSGNLSSSTFKDGIQIISWISNETSTCSDLDTTSYVCKDLNANLTETTYWKSLTDDTYLIPNSTSLPITDTSSNNAELKVNDINPDAWKGSVKFSETANESSSENNGLFYYSSSKCTNTENCTLDNISGASPTSAKLTYKKANAGDNVLIDASPTDAVCNDNLYFEACKSLSTTINGISDNIYLNNSTTQPIINYTGTASSKWTTKSELNMGVFEDGSAAGTFSNDSFSATGTTWSGSVTYDLIKSGSPITIHTEIANEDLRCFDDIVLEYCGDGLTNNGEECDPKDPATQESCSDTCTRILAPIACEDDFSVGFEPNVIDFDAVEDGDADATITSTINLTLPDIYWEGDLFVAVCSNPTSPADCIATLSETAFNDFISDNSYITNNYFSLIDENSTESSLKISHDSSNTPFTFTNFNFIINSNDISRGESVLVWIEEAGEVTSCLGEQYYCSEFGGFEVENEGSGIGAVFKKVIQTANAQTVVYSPVTVSSPEEILKASVEVFGTSSNWKGNVFLGVCSNLDINDPYLNSQDCIDNAPASESNIIFQNAYIAPNSSTTINQVTDPNQKRVGEFDSSDYDANNNINILTQDGGATFVSHVINFNLAGAQNYISSELKGINEADLYVAIWCDGQEANCFEIIPIIFETPVCKNLDATINDLTYIASSKAFLLPNETLPTVGYAAEIKVDNFSPDRWEGNLTLDTSNANAKYDCDNSGAADDKSCTIIATYGDTIERDYYFADGNDKLSVSTDDGSSACKEDLQLTACKDLFISNFGINSEADFIYVPVIYNDETGAVDYISPYYFSLNIEAYNDKWQNQYKVETQNGYVSTSLGTLNQSQITATGSTIGDNDLTFTKTIYYQAQQTLIDSHQKGIITSNVINEDIRCKDEVEVKFCGDGTQDQIDYDQDGDYEDAYEINEECDYGVNNGKDGYTCSTECKITSPSTVGVCNDSFTAEINPPVLDFEAGEDTIDTEATINLTDPDGDGQFMWDEGQVHFAICNDPASVEKCLASLSDTAITAWTNTLDYPTQLTQVPQAVTGYNTSGYLILEATGEAFSNGTLKLNFQGTNISKGESVVVWATDTTHNNQNACAYIQNYCEEFEDFELNKIEGLNLNKIFAWIVDKATAAENQRKVVHEPVYISSPDEVYNSSVTVHGTSSAWKGDVFMAVCTNTGSDRDSNAQGIEACKNSPPTSSVITYDNIFINSDEQFLDDDPNIDKVQYYDGTTHAVVYSVEGETNKLSTDITGFQESLYVALWCDGQEANCFEVIPVIYTQTSEICEDINLDLQEDANWKKIGKNANNDDVYLLPNAAKSQPANQTQTANLSGYFNDDNWTVSPDNWTGNIDFERISSGNPLFYNATTCNPAVASCVFENTNGTEDPWETQYQSAYAGDKITISGIDGDTANCKDTIEITACDDLYFTDTDGNPITSIYINSNNDKTINLTAKGKTEAWTNTINVNTTNGSVDPNSYTASNTEDIQLITYTPDYEGRILAHGNSSLNQTIQAFAVNEDLRCKSEINIEYCGDGIAQNGTNNTIDYGEECDYGVNNGTTDSNCSEICKILVCEDLNITDIDDSNYSSDKNIDYTISIAPDNWSGSFTTEILRQGLGRPDYNNINIKIYSIDDELNKTIIKSCDSSNICTTDNLNVSDSKNLFIQIHNLDADDKVTFYTDDKSEQCTISDTLLLLGDYVWFDQNDDGIQNDPSENGINETTVNLYADPDSDGICSADDFIASTVTADDIDGNSGYYYFPVDENSDYCVEFVNPNPDQYAVCPQFQGSEIKTDSNPDPNSGIANAQIIQNSDLSIDACYFLPVCEDLNITDIDDSNYSSDKNIDYTISIAPDNWSGSFTTEILRQGLGQSDYNNINIKIYSLDENLDKKLIKSCDSSNTCTTDNLNVSDSKNLFIQIQNLDADDKVIFFTDDKSEQCTISDTLLLLGDYVWFDQNGDGIQNDPSENGINGTTVNLYADPDSDGVCSSDNFIASTVTANDIDGNSGYYYFPVDDNSDYCVEFVNPNPDQYALCPQSQGSDIETDSNPDQNSGIANAQIIQNSDLSIDACYFLPVCLDLLVNSDYSNIYDGQAIYTVNIDSDSTIGDLWTGDITVNVYNNNDESTQVDSIIFDDGNSSASCVRTEDPCTLDPMSPTCLPQQPTQTETTNPDPCVLNPADPICQTTNTEPTCDPVIDPTCGPTVNPCTIDPMSPECLTNPQNIPACDPIINPTCTPLPTEPIPAPTPQPQPLITKTYKNNNLFTSIIDMFNKHNNNLKTDLLASYTNNGGELKCSAHVDSEVFQPITITINGLLPDYRVEILTDDNNVEINQCYFSESILKLGDFVWIDNGDYTQSPTEQSTNGQNGINVQLYQADENGICTDILLDETQTQNDPETEYPGYYYFPVEPNANYCVTFAPLPGYEFCQQTTGDDITMDSNPNPTTGTANNIHIENGNDITIDACYVDIACENIAIMKDDKNLNNQIIPIEDYDPTENFDFEAIVSPSTWLGSIEARSASPDSQFIINQETNQADISYRNGNYGDIITVTADNGSCPANFSIDTPDCISLDMAETFSAASNEDNAPINATFDLLAENSRWTGTILIESNGNGVFNNPYIDYNNPNVSNESVLATGNPISIQIDGDKETALYSILVEYANGGDDDQITISVVNEESTCSDTKSLANENSPGGGGGGDYTICGNGDMDIGEACDYAIKEGEADYNANCTSSCTISTPSSFPDDENGNEDEDNTTPGGGGEDEDENPQPQQETKEPLFDKKAFLNNNTAVKSASIPSRNDHANYILTYWNNGSNYSSLTVTDTLGQIGFIDGYSNEQTTGDYIKPWPDSEFYYNYELEKWPNNAANTIADCEEDSTELCHIAGTSIFSPDGAQFKNISDYDIITIIYQGQFELGKFNCNDDNCGAEEFPNTANANATNDSGKTKVLPDSDILYALCKYLITRNSGDVLLYSPLESGADLSCLSSDEVRNTTGLAITKQQETTTTLPSTGEEDYESTASLCDNREDNGSVISDFSSFMCELKLEILDIWEPENISNSIEKNIEREAETYDNLNTFDSETNKDITINYLSDLDLLDSESQDPTKKIYRKTDGGNLIINPANENFFTEGAYTFIVENGDLIIEGNLKYNKNEYNYEQIPSVAFIVIGGNIEIASNVTDIVGVYYTETNDEGTGGNIQSQNDSHSDYQLRIYGSVFGNLNPIISTRDYIGDPERDGANVKIIYDARILLNTPPGLEEFIGTSFTDIAR